MTPGNKALRNGEGDQDEGPEERRRSRLWLGYSEDNLCNQQSMVGDLSQPQDEGLAPSPITSLSLSHNGTRAYHVPADYENLDEIAAPSPIKNPGKDREQGYLEDRDDKLLRDEDGVPPEFRNLNEVADPAPVGKSKKDDTHSKLEDRKTDWSAKDGEMDDIEPATIRQGVSKLATETYTISYLVFFSILGTLARLGLQALTLYPGAPVQTGLLWCNVGGSLIMGLLSEDRKLFRKEWAIKAIENDKKDSEKGAQGHDRSESVSKQRAVVKKGLPLYIGLATGFCGSFTSFSSFMRDAFFALSNALPVPINHPSSAPIFPTVNVQRNPGYSFLAILAVLITTIGLSLMAVLFGAHIALFLEPFTPSIPYLARKVIDRSVVILAFGCWLAAVFMAIWPPDRPGGPVGDASWAQETWRSQALFALVFAPPGCLLRFYVSLYLNGRIKAFPLGTFAVNIFGTIMEAVFLDLQRVPVGGMVGCQVLQGMLDGFCGCLTTVSTWVTELTALRIKHAYFYGSMSVGIALSILVIITGSLQWTNGFAHPLCTT